jgi:hypothetical protein
LSCRDTEREVASEWQSFKHKKSAACFGINNRKMLQSGEASSVVLMMWLNRSSKPQCRSELKLAAHDLDSDDAGSLHCSISLKLASHAFLVVYHFMNVWSSKIEYDFAS